MFFDQIKEWVISFSKWLKLEDKMSISDAVSVWSDLLYIVPILVSALYILIAFQKNNKIKAAELLLKLEEDYRKHFNILLDIEYQPVKNLESVIPKVYRFNQLTPEEDKLIEDFEMCLRHFLITYILHNKRVDSKLFNQAHKYYLVQICYGSKPFVTKYVLDYWPSVYRWFLKLHLNWLTRFFILSLIMDHDLPNFQHRKCNEYKAKTKTIRYRSSFRGIERAISKLVSNRKWVNRLIKKQLDNSIQRA